MTGLVIDNFAGGGGASTGIEQALGVPVDVAINHDPAAIAMHKANHPDTHHHCQSVWRADPKDVVREAAKRRPDSGGRVRLAWFSPDCKHFSKAKGGAPVRKEIRDLAWVVVLWAKRVRPDVIMLENVEEFQTWCPLVDGQPDFTRKGETFRAWVRELQKLGYKVEWRELRACDYGAPTTRKRLFVVARCDGRPIVWPAPTHGPAGSADVLAGRLLPWRSAASCIDWSIPCPSIFERSRPLKDNTCRRIAAGIMRYVINAERRFIVPLTHHGSASRVYDADQPIPTITGANRGEMALITPVTNGTWNPDRSWPADEPLRTITTAKGGEYALVSAFMAQHNTGVVGHDMASPVSTITARGTQQAIVTGHLEVMRNNATGRDLSQPAPTLTASGTHMAMVTSHLEVTRRGAPGRDMGGPVPTLTSCNHMAEVRAFLVKYYGNDTHGQGVGDPLHTIPTRERFGLVTCNIGGQEYAIADIGMRMLTPRELFRAQGFPDSYIIDPPVDGRAMTKTASIARCGNSVCPPLARALVEANCVDVVQERAAA
jgi:DNA (cytosine-5)-methyltransferase 1